MQHLFKLSNMTNPILNFLNLFNPWAKEKTFVIESPIVIKEEELIEEIISLTIYKDPTTLKRIELLHPKLRAEAHKIYDEICLNIHGNVIIRFTWTLRTMLEQSKLYEQGRKLPGKIVTWAKAGFSYHNYGMAIDIVILIDKDGNGTYEQVSYDYLADYDKDGLSDWMEVVAIFKSYGWEWGGDWLTSKDRPHFQKTLGYKTSELMKLKTDKKGYPIL